MNRNQLARLLARLSHRSRAQAADDVDTLVYQMLKELKRPPNRAPEERTSAVASANSKEKS